MGLQITTPSKNQILIDWFSFTLPHFDPKKAIALLGLDFSQFTLLERGGMGYKQRYIFESISIFFDGTEKMGVHVEMKGQGCRFYEGLSKHSWTDLIALVMLDDGHFTRIDIASDNVDGSLNLKEIESYIDSGRTRTQFRQFGSIRSKKLTADLPETAGETLYFGSPTSKIRFRLYDKNLEQNIENPERPWIRFEMQLRDERANTIAEYILNRDDLGKIFSAVCNNYLSFINLDDSNKSRCSLMPWWAVWLQTVEKLKLTLLKAKKKLHDLMDSLKRQYAPTITTIKQSLGVARFSDFLSDLIEEGTSRLTKKHEDIINQNRPYYLNYNSGLPF